MRLNVLSSRRPGTLVDVIEKRQTQGHCLCRLSLATDTINVNIAGISMALQRWQVIPLLTTRWDVIDRLASTLVLYTSNF